MTDHTNESVEGQLHALGTVAEILPPGIAARSWAAGRRQRRRARRVGSVLGVVLVVGVTAGALGIVDAASPRSARLISPAAGSDVIPTPSATPCSVVTPTPPSPDPQIRRIVLSRPAPGFPVLLYQQPVGFTETFGDNCHSLYSEYALDWSLAAEPELTLSDCARGCAAGPEPVQASSAPAPVNAGGGRIDGNSLRASRGLEAELTIRRHVPGSLTPDSKNQLYGEKVLGTTTARGVKALIVQENYSSDDEIQLVLTDGDWDILVVARDAVEDGTTGKIVSQVFPPVPPLVALVNSLQIPAS